MTNLTWKGVVLLGVACGASGAAWESCRSEAPAVTFDADADTGWFREEDGGTAFAFNGKRMVLDPGDFIAVMRDESGETVCGVEIAEDGGVRLVGPRPGLCAEWVPEKWR